MRIAARRITEWITISVLFISAGIASLPRTANLVRESALLLRLSHEQRGTHLLGADEASARALAAAIPEELAVALVMREEHDIHRGIFINAALYPRRVRIYRSPDEYRAAASKAGPDVILLFDGAHSDPLRRVEVSELP